MSSKSSKRKGPINPRAEPAKPPLLRRLAREHAGIVVLTLLGAALRLYEIGTRGLWVDEVITWNFARTNFYDPWSGHGIYFLLVDAAVALFGESEFALRSVSFVFGVASIPMIYACGLALWGKREGLLAASALTVSTWLIFFSQEARYYTGFFFFVALILFGLIQTWQTGKLRYVLLMLATVPVLRGIHPTAMVFCGIALAWLAIWLAAWPEGRSALWNWITWGSRRWDRRAIATTVAAGIAVLAALVFAYEKSPIYRSILASLSFENETENVEFTSDFFLLHYRMFSLANIPTSLLAPLISALNLIAFVGGWYRSFRARLPFALMTLTLLVATFLLLFSYETFQPYELKYSMFFYPPLLVLLGGGLVWAFDSAAHLLKQGRREQIQRWAVAGACLAIVLGGFDHHRRHFGKAFSAFKKALVHVKESYEPGDQIVSHDFGRAPVQYHAPRLGIPLADYTMLEPAQGDGELEIARIESLALKNRELWFIGSLNWRVNDKLADYVQSHFELSEKFDSMWGERFEVQAYRWKWPSRTATGAEKLIISDARLTLNADEPTTVSLFVARTGIYDVRLWSDAPVSIAENEIAFKTTEDEGGVLSEGKLLLTRGPAELTIALKAGERGRVSRIEIEPDAMQSIKIEAERPTLMQFPGRSSQRYIGDAQTIIFPVNGGAWYDVLFPASGLLRVDVFGLHKKPGNVYFEASIDGEPKALLRFGDANDQWGWATIVLRASPGKHRLGLYFLTDVPTGPNPDQDVDGILDRMEIKGLSAEEAESIDDDRIDPKILVNDFSDEAVEAITVPPVGLPLTEETIWTPQETDAAVVVPDFSPESAAIRVKLPPFQGTAISSKPFQVTPGKGVYYQVELATERVINHTANVGLIFWGADSRPTHQAWLYASRSGLQNAAHWAEGTNHNMERQWQRFATLQPVPPNSVAATMVLVCYKNGQKQVPRDGTAWYRNIRLYRPSDLSEEK